MWQNPYTKKQFTNKEKNHLLVEVIAGNIYLTGLYRCSQKQIKLNGISKPILFPSFTQKPLEPVINLGHWAII
jgi:hypothetical protein